MKMKRRMLNNSARSMYKRIKKTRQRAEWVGTFYLFATLLLGFLAFMPTLDIPYLNVIPGLRKGGTVLWQDFKFGLTIDFISRTIYALMLIMTVINVCRMFGCLGWLFKKKASRTYGFNRNVYAMQSLESIFSSAIAVRLIGNTLLLLINGTYGGATKFDFSVLKGALVSINELSFGLNIDIPVALGFVAVGVLFRLLCGFLGGKASLFTTEDGSVTEVRREVGRFAPLFRNFLQIAVVLAIPVILLMNNQIYGFVADLINKKFTVNIEAFMQLALFLFWMVLTAHAMNATEYNIDGAEGKGMANFRVFIIFTFFIAAMLLVWNCMGGEFNFKNFKFDIKNVHIFHMLLLVCGSFVMSLIEILMRNAPGYPNRLMMGESEYVDEESGESDDVDYSYYF